MNAGQETTAMSRLQPGPSTVMFRKLLWVLLAPAACLFCLGTAAAAPLRVAIAGDVWLRQKQQPSSLHYAAPLFRRADVAIVNLEGPLTTRSQRTPNKSARDLQRRYHFVLRADPRAASCLREAGVDVVGLANNHLMDYRTGGCLDTIRTARRLGLATTGAGSNIGEARAPAFVRTRRGTVAVLAYLAFMSPGGRAACTPAGAKSAGVAIVRPNGAGTALSDSSRQAVARDIAAARRRAGVVVVMFHWGTEGASRPSAYQRSLAHAAIKLGASAVVGHHPHVLEGVEWFMGRPICYSLGNFVFPAAGAGKADTGIAEIIFERSRATKLRFHPMRISGCTPAPLTGSAGTAASRRLLQLSRGFAVGRTVRSPDGTLTLLRPQ